MAKTFKVNFYTWDKLSFSKVIQASNENHAMAWACNMVASSKRISDFDVQPQ